MTHPHLTISLHLARNFGNYFKCVRLSVHESVSVMLTLAVQLEFLLVSVSSCCSLLFPASPRRFLLVLVRSCSSLLVPASPCWFLLVPVGSCWPLLVPVGLCWFLLLSVGSC